MNDTIDTVATGAIGVGTLETIQAIPIPDENIKLGFEVLIGLLTIARLVSNWFKKNKAAKGAKGAKGAK